MKKFKTKKKLTAEKKLYPLGTLLVEKKGKLVVNEKLVKKGREME